MSEADEELVRMLQMGGDELDAYFQSLPPDKSSTVLVNDLLTKPVTPAREALIKRAKALFYDDFKSTYEGVCPKVKLVEDLTDAGFHDLAQRAMEGAYD